MKRCPTLLYLDVFRFYDASRAGLIAAFRKLGVRVIVANFPFHHLSQQDDLCEALVNLLNKDGYEINAVISMNVSGLSARIRRLVEDKSIVHAVWFIDSPFLYPKLDEVQRTKVFAASRDFSDHPQISKSEWLPFAGYSPLKPQREPEANIGFLGTLLPLTHYIVKFRRGIIGSQSGLVIPDFDFYEKARLPAFTIGETWVSDERDSIPAAEILNYVSSHHRVMNLSYFSDFGLEITGPDNWQTELWAVAPHLLKNFRKGAVSSEKGMRDYLSRYRVCLNIFHLQNLAGGPNFRTLDAASNYIPCLSEANAGCAEIFPDGEAAIYYQNCDDARYKAKLLLGDPSLREKIARTAADIVNEGHTFERRARQLCDHLHIKIPSVRDTAPLIYLHWPDGIWTRSPVTEAQIDSGANVDIAQPSLPKRLVRKARPMWKRLARSVRKRLPLSDHALRS